jgi:diphthamide biosynthesis methyltransferase
MCIICVGLEKDRLTSFEARRNFCEMKPFLGDHVEEVERKMLEKEIEEILKGYIDFTED